MQSSNPDNYYQVAWLRYHCGKEPKEIAAKFGVSTSCVSRWLKKAEKDGLVTFQVIAPALEDLECELRERFNLSRVRVCSSLKPFAEMDADSYDRLQYEELGKVAASFLGMDFFDLQGIGLGGGRGVTSFARHISDTCNLTNKDGKTIRLFALHASSHEPFDISATSATAIAAALLNSRIAQFTRRRSKSARSNLPKVFASAIRLPTTLSDESTKLVEDEFYTEVMQHLRMVITGVGAIESCWVLSQEERLELQDRGVVGDILYDLFGESGEPFNLKIKGALHSFGISRLSNLVAECGEVIVIACGKKMPVLYEALKSNNQFITGLITDEQSAHALKSYPVLKTN